MGFRDNWVKVSRSNPLIKKIIQRTFPDYKGRKVNLCPQEHPLDVKSYWSGGTRSYFVFYNLTLDQTQEMPQQSAFDMPVQGADAVMLPSDVICVEHCYFCGSDLGIRIHLPQRQIPELFSEIRGLLTQQ